MWRSSKASFVVDIRLQEVVLDFFFDVLNIKTPNWYQTFIDGRRLTSAFKKDN